jgi:hypothetical protein
MLQEVAEELAKANKNVAEAGDPRARDDDAVRSIQDREAALNKKKAEV